METEIYRIAQKYGDPKGETAPTPSLISQAEYGGEAFWQATNWPLWEIRTLLDDILARHALPEEEYNTIKRLVLTDPVAAWQVELDKVRVAYDRWRPPMLRWSDFPSWENAKITHVGISQLEGDLPE